MRVPKTPTGSTLIVVVLTIAGCRVAQSPVTATEQTHTTEPQQALTEQQLEDVQATARVGSRSLERCYQEEIESLGKAYEANVVLKVHIQTSGAVSEVQFGDTNITSKSFLNCIERNARLWEFPRLSSSTWFSYPYRFSAAY